MPLPPPVTRATFPERQFGLNGDIAVGFDMVMNCYNSSEVKLSEIDLIEDVCV